MIHIDRREMLKYIIPASTSYDVYYCINTRKFYFTQVLGKAMRPSFYFYYEQLHEFTFGGKSDEEDEVFYFCCYLDTLAKETEV